MDPQVESKAIEILATQGQAKYREFLKSKGALDFLSSEEIAIVTLPDFDFQTICDRIKSRPAVALASVVPQSAEGGVTEVGETSYILFSPPTGLVSIPITLLGMINMAQENVQVAMYTFTDMDIFSAMYKKATAGVRVSMVLDRSQLHLFTNKLRDNPEAFPTKPAKMYIGVVTGVTRGSYTGIAHEKFMVVDSKRAFTGSYNFTWSAANINRELGVFTTNAGGSTPPIIITGLQEQMNELLVTSIPYDWPN